MKNDKNAIAQNKTRKTKKSLQSTINNATVE